MLDRPFFHVQTRFRLEFMTIAESPGSDETREGLKANRVGLHVEGSPNRATVFE